MLEQEAARLSGSLGVGKLPNNLKTILLGFVKEGIRYSFSQDVAGADETLFLGARLPFLRLMAKYLVWTRKDKEQTKILREHLDTFESALRRHKEFETVYPEDLDSIADFRKVGDLGPYRIPHRNSRGSAASVHSGASRRRLSLGGTSLAGSSAGHSKASTQSSLSPLYEEDGEDPSPAKESMTSSLRATQSMDHSAIQEDDESSQSTASS